MGHSHLHSHPPDHHGHLHSHSTSTGTLIGAAFWINAWFMVIEAVGGWFTHSLALMADAGHMLNDVLSLGLAWGAYRLSAKAAQGAYTYGYRRAQVLAALANAVSLGAIIVFVAMEAVGRIRTPQPVLANQMLIIAVAGFIANLGSGALLFMRRDESLNIRGAFLHLIADALGSVAAIVAAIAIKITGWYILDPLLGLLIALIIAVGAWRLMRDSIAVLMEKAPAGYSEAKLMAALEEVEGVKEIHDLHVWQLDDGKPIASVHVVVDGVSENHQTILERCLQIFREKFSIDHATIQIESESWASCRIDCRPHHAA